MQNTGRHQKQMATGKDTVALQRLFLSLEPVDVNDGGQSQL